jgi:trk system potassium uptake protein TrkH
MHARAGFVRIVFEAVSAFGTVGLSTGITPQLSGAGKIVVVLLMFIGRLGPITLLTALQSWQSEPHYRWPEEDVVIG